MGKTSTGVKRRYNEKAYDRINLTVKKGNKSIITEYAQKKGESVNGFINRIVCEAMQVDGVILPNEKDNTQSELDGVTDGD